MSSESRINRLSEASMRSTVHKLKGDIGRRQVLYCDSNARGGGFEHEHMGEKREEVRREGIGEIRRNYNGRLMDSSFRPHNL